MLRSSSTYLTVAFNAASDFRVEISDTNGILTGSTSQKNVSFGFADLLAFNDVIDCEKMQKNNNNAQCFIVLISFLLFQKKNRWQKSRTQKEICIEFH
jgi:hypothetical protein